MEALSVGDCNSDSKLEGQVQENQPEIPCGVPKMQEWGAVLQHHEPHKRN